MKRVRDFIELSDEEWSIHSESFKPSRILKPQSTSKNPPPIESFAYSKPSTSNANTNSVDIIECSSSSSEELKNPAPNELEDDDVDMQVSTRPNRGNRFVIDDDEEDEGHAKTDFWSEDDDEELVVEEEEEEEDVVKKALRKCEKISAELKRDLYGTASAACDRYAEVELSSTAVRIVTQVVVYLSVVFILD